MTDLGLAFLKTFVTLFSFYIIVFISNLTFFSRIEKKIALKNKNSLTIIVLLKRILKMTLAIISVILITGFFGFDLSKLLTAAGFFGIIIGLGLQSLMTDLLSGIFIVTEGYFKIGDTVIIENFRGEILDIGVRTTKLRNYLGEEMYVANGLIRKVINLNTIYSMAINEIDVDASNDLEFVSSVIIEFLKDYKDAVIIDQPKLLGVEKVTNSARTFRITTKVKSGEQFGYQRRMNELLATLFKEHNISTPVFGANNHG